MNLMFAFGVLLSIVIVRSVSRFDKLEQGEIGLIKEYCGWSYNQDPQKFKVQGRTPKRGDFPWVVLLRTLHTNDVHYMIPSIEETFPETVISTCTGILISPRHVLTAAHCMCDFKIIFKRQKRRRRGEPLETPECIRIEPKKITAILDVVEIEVKLTNFYMEGSVEELNRGKEYDWAILELAANVSKEVIEGGYIRPICLTNTHPRAPLKRNGDLWVAGYGYPNNQIHGPTSPTGLHSKRVSVDRALCRQEGPRPISRCFPLAAQNGDSGMPYMAYDKDLRAYLLGIQSFVSKDLDEDLDVAWATDTESDRIRAPLFQLNRLLGLYYDIY